MEERMSWDDYFMKQAELVSERATCGRLKVGSVLVKDKRVVGTGYNGSVSGLEHCTDKNKSLCEGGCLNDQKRCVKSVHSELNTLLHARREDCEGATMYVTHEPCENCTKYMNQTGVKRVVFKHAYYNKYNEYFSVGMDVEQLGSEKKKVEEEKVNE